MVEPNADPTHGSDGPLEDDPDGAARARHEAAGGGSGAPLPPEQPIAPAAPDVPGAGTDAATDSEFARIVADLDDVREATADVDAQARRWLTDVPVLPGVRPPGPRDHLASQEEIDLEDAQSHFVPPDPGPVLGGDPVLTTAWFAVGTGIVALVVSALLVHHVPAVVAWVGAGLLAAGAGVLLWRLPHERGDDPGDDAPWV